MKQGLAIASRFVLSGEEPLRLVIHHDDGTWDFLCNTTSAPDDLLTVHAQEIFSRYPELAELQTLPLGWLAEREEAGDAWRVERDLDQF